MDTKSVSKNAVVQPDDQSTIILPPAPVRKTHYAIYILAFIFVAVAEAIISYFLFIKKPIQKFSAVGTVSTTSSLPSPTLTPVLSKTPASTPSAGPSPQVSPTLKPLTSPTPQNASCVSTDQNCIFTNIIDNFANGCVPVEVTATTDTAQITLILSPGANGACRFQMKGLGMDQNCLFAKENVTTNVIKGMLGMDNIATDPAFIKIKAASCK